MINMCNCRSYNQPEESQEVPEIILPKPKWSSKTNGICVDACIADAIVMLWDNGIITRGCCCGHNKLNPSVIVDESEDPIETLHLLTEYDDRDWNVYRWELISYNNEVKV